MSEPFEVRVSLTRLEIEAVSDQDFRVATDAAILDAYAQHPEIRWFRVKRLGGVIQDGLRAGTRIRVEVGP